MSKQDTYKKLATELWNDEIIDQNNYNYNYDEFEKDFFKHCEKVFADYTFIIGKIIT